jgi:hypothetical protein
LRPRGKREPALAAGAIPSKAAASFCILMVGSKEDAETMTPFFEDMKLPGLEVPP